MCECVDFFTQQIQDTDTASQTVLMIVKKKGMLMVMIPSLWNPKRKEIFKHGYTLFVKLSIKLESRMNR